MLAPELVTLTGADDDTDIARMAVLSARFPVEWGILFAPQRHGSGRFPSLDFVGRLIGHGALRLSAHLCGGYARQVVADGTCADLAAMLTGHFQRVQINTAARNLVTGRIRRFADAMRISGAILQCRGEFPANRDVDWLFDKSGGQGTVPTAWPQAPLGAFCGYAGGINADNIGAILPKIAAALPAEQPYWIDMESGLRTEADRFDLDQCELVLMQVYPDR